VGNDIKKRYNLNPIVIYNGIKINKVRQREEPFNFRKKLKMLQIGRLKHKVKGQDLAIKAIKGLSRKYNLSLDFIGDGQSKSYLMDLVNEYNLSSIINFLGLKKKGWIYDNIYHYDLLIMPSINEGFGLTVVEGIAAKIPVLVSNIEGPMEIINNGEFGFYFESNNVEDLKSKIVEIIKTDIDFISSQTDNAYDYCKSNFDVKVTAMNYLNNY
jgi:glycosyltransferase involved in cell wall biosynthesis